MKVLYPMPVFKQTTSVIQSRKCQRRDLSTNLTPKMHRYEYSNTIFLENPKVWYVTDTQINYLLNIFFIYCYAFTFHILLSIY